MYDFLAFPISFRKKSQCLDRENVLSQNKSYPVFFFINRILEPFSSLFVSIKVSIFSSVGLGDSFLKILNINKELF